MQFVAWVSRRAPLLLAFEDLHLADTASLELIAYAGRRLSRTPVLLILTRRRLPSRQDLDAVLGALRSRGALVAEIDVRPLADDAARRLIKASADLPAEAVEQIVRLAAGSPLLAVETARAVARDGADLAAGLSGAARLAISRLSGQARVFVEFLAAAGRDLDRPEVASLPLQNPARAAAEALGSGLLRAADGQTGFRHALLRDAVYQEIPDPIRTRLHHELAQLLRNRGRPSDSRAQYTRGSRRGLRAAEIARHLILAGQDEQAVSYLILAAQDARSVAAMTEAADFLTEATAIEPHDPDLLVELAEVEAFRGLLESSDNAFDRALEQISPQDAGALISAWLRRGPVAPRRSLPSSRVAPFLSERARRAGSRSCIRSLRAGRGAGRQGVGRSGRWRAGRGRRAACRDRPDPRSVTGRATCSRTTSGWRAGTR